MNAPLFRFPAAFLFLFGSFAFGPLDDARGEQGDAVIKVVSSLPRTGSARGQTDTIVNGIIMAIEEAGSKVAPPKAASPDAAPHVPHGR